MKDLILTSLATYRLTKLVIEDEITADIRDVIFNKFDPRETKIGYLFTCPWCVSIWAAGALTLLSVINPKVGEAVKTILSASAATGLITTQIT